MGSAIVVGLDYSTAGAAALRHAIDVASRRAAPLIVVRAFELPAQPWVVLERDVVGERVAAHTRAQQWLAEAVGHGAPDVPWRLETPDGLAADALLGVAPAAALIVIGMPRASASSLPRLVRASPVPVEVVDPDGVVHRGTDGNRAVGRVGINAG